MDSPINVKTPLSSELVRLIRNNVSEFDRFEGSLMAAAEGGVPRSILVTSCNPGEGKTTSAAGIGVSIAARGTHSVLLVDAHVRKPRLHRLFSQEMSPGLAEVVMDNVSWQQAINVCSEVNLHVLSAGKHLDNPLQVFRAPRFSAVLEELKAHYDCIIFDGPPFFNAPECAHIAPLIQGVLLVVSCEQTRREPLSVVKSRIESVQGNVLGCIMNRRKYYIPDFLYGFF